MQMIRHQNVTANHPRVRRFPSLAESVVNAIVRQPTASICRNYSQEDNRRLPQRNENPCAGRRRPIRPSSFDMQPSNGRERLLPSPNFIALADNHAGSAGASPSHRWPRAHSRGGPTSFTAAPCVSLSTRIAIFSTSFSSFGRSIWKSLLPSIRRGIGTGDVAVSLLFRLA